MNLHLRQFLCAFALIGVLSIGVEAAVQMKSETAIIQTSAICEKCKARIEGVLKAMTGIESANLNLNTKKIKVRYDANQVSVEQIRTKISKTGYDADNLKGDAEAFKNLPSCCQKPAPK